MSQAKTQWHPGEIVPASGSYACDCGAVHHWSTDVKGHRFPAPAQRLHRRFLLPEDRRAPRRPTGRATGTARAGSPRGQAGAGGGVMATSSTSNPSSFSR